MFMKNMILTEEELQPAVTFTKKMLDQLNAILLGNDELHTLVLIGIISRGHILLEGVPGVGKTALVKALSEIMKLEFNRVQFTPDLMPSDILGTHILQESEDGRELTFEKGPVFTNILLADEINRASPKTQSALLESMQEGSVTLLGETRQLPKPFFVLASQNPLEQEGTYPLPEAQLDRFLFKLNVKMADSDVLYEIINNRRRGQAPQPNWSLNADDLEQLFSVMEQIYLPKAVANYIARIVSLTHADKADAPDVVKNYVAFGASPRAAIALAEAARARALIKGRATVGFEDVNALLDPVLNHRLILNYKARVDKVDVFKVILELQNSIDEANLKLPKSVEVVSC